MSKSSKVMAHDVLNAAAFATNTTVRGRHSARVGVVFVAALAAHGALSGCRTMAPNARSGGSTGVLAALEGLEAEDRQLAGLSFNLFCGTTPPIVGTLQGSGQDELIRFPGEAIKDGDECALEVRADVASDPAFIWHAKPAEQAAGLLYGSDKAKVVSRQLSLTLYKLYTRTSGNTFSAALDVAFDLTTPETALPDLTKVTASMACGDEQAVTGAWRKGEKDNEGTFTFVLDTTKFKGKSCAKVTVLEGQVARFEGDLDPAVVTFLDPKRGELVKFTKRFTLKPRPVSGDALVTTVAGMCINYDAAARRCSDRRTFELPREQNFWVARVDVKDQSQNKLTLFVSPGSRGFPLDKSGRVKTTIPMTASLKKAATATERDAFTWWPATIASDLFTYTFDDNFIAGGYHTNFTLSRENVEEASVLHVDKVWFHGFAPVTKATLDKYSSARWLAVVEAKKGGETAKFIVSGPRNYFWSEKPRAGTQAAPEFFTWESFKADRDNKTGFWKVWALKGEAMAPAGCEADLSSYLDRFSLRHLGEVDVAAGGDALIDACHVTAPSKTWDTGWEITPSFWEFGWHELN